MPRSRAPKSSYCVCSTVSCMNLGCCRYTPWHCHVRQSSLSCSFACRARDVVATLEIPCPIILYRDVRRFMSRQHGCEKVVVTKKLGEVYCDREFSVATELLCRAPRSSVHQGHVAARPRRVAARLALTCQLCRVRKNFLLRPTLS